MTGFIPRARVSLTCALLASGGALAVSTNAAAAQADNDDAAVTPTNIELISQADAAPHGETPATGCSTLECMLLGMTALGAGVSVLVSTAKLERP